MPERETASWVEAGGCVKTIWALVGDEGAITFTLRTGGGYDALPMGIDVHSKTAPEHHEFCGHVTDCDFTGGECWVDGTCLGASDLWRTLLASATPEKNPDMDLVWDTLSEWYASQWPQSVELQQQESPDA